MDVLIKSNKKRKEKVYTRKDHMTQLYDLSLYIYIYIYIYKINLNRESEISY